MQTYEYLTLPFQTNQPLHPGRLDQEIFQAQLNAQGADGWELVSAFTTNQSNGITHAVTAVFKRPLPTTT